MNKVFAKHFDVYEKPLLKENYIIYIENKKDELINNYISQNYDELAGKFKDRGFVFIYIPLIEDLDMLAFSDSLDYVRYVFPQMIYTEDDDLLNTIKYLANSLSPQEIYDYIYSELDYSANTGPSLLMRSAYDNRHLSPNNIIFRFFYQEITCSNIEETELFFNNLFQDVSGTSEYKRFLIKQSKDLSALLLDDEGDEIPYIEFSFNSTLKDLTDEGRQLIESLKPDEYGAIAEMLIYIIHKIKKENPAVIKEIIPLIEKLRLNESAVHLSPIVVDEHYKFFLPDYGNQEVKMHALPRAVYILFLRHPEGIRFKEIYLYRDELLEIYNKVTNRYDNDEIEQAIDDLIDMTNPSLNQKCARIREAFRKIMDENLAQYYYIDGLNGYPKKIKLPERLIEFRC